MNSQFKKIVISIFIIATLTNLAILNYIVSSKKDSEVLLPQASDNNESENTCEECRDYVDEKLQLIEDKVESTDLNSATTRFVSTSIRETYLPLGSGNSTAKDWEDIPGMEVSLDTSKYSNIDSALFETTIRIPNGNQQVWVRLFNSTDKHPVWFSDVTHAGGEVKSVSSDPISLSQGKKTYQVQARTQLGDNVEVLNARIKLAIK